jgi:glycosyltransferase involved in cell wall biosynthesis
MTPRRILVVTYAYPPMPSVGGNRWLAMSKYLRRAGHSVTILTTTAFGRSNDAEEVGIVRSDDLLAARWLRTLLRRPPLPEGGESPPVDKPVPGIITRLVVPDHHLLTWVPFAAQVARALHRDQPFDCIVTTSAYESTHLLALMLGRRRPAWVADFRDGWTFHSWREPFPTRLQANLDLCLEARVVRSAERTAVVERPVGEDFRHRLGIDAVHVPNGWDGELEQEVRMSELPTLPVDRIVMVHTGRMLGGWGRSPRPLLEALARLRTEQPTLSSRLLLVLAGRPDREEQELIDSYPLGGLIHRVGHLSRGGAMALQRRSDALILLTAPDLVWELPGKLFEYIGARRPILALAAGNEAARVVQETGTGVTVSPDDQPAIVAALALVARGELAGACSPHDTQRYEYPAPAHAMAAEIERAIIARMSRSRDQPGAAAGS